MLSIHGFLLWCSSLNVIELFFMLNRGEHKIVTARNTDIAISLEISSPKPVIYSTNKCKNANNLGMIKVSLSVKLGMKTVLVSNCEFVTFPLVSCVRCGT